MCRLFGLTAGPERVKASFWLLDSSDSLQLQGRRNRDGTGLGFFDVGGAPIVDRQPEPAYSDLDFIRDARTVESRTFVAHVRIATTGLVSAENTHPFTMDGRIMAHNGGFEGLDVLEAELGPDLARVRGDTDSERLFALITQRIARHDGDVSAGLTDAVTWVAQTLPLYSLNLVLITASGLWALRYPDHHRLHVLRRDAGTDHDSGDLQARSALLEVSSPHLASHPSVVVASEPMDDHPGWRLMDSGELVHVDAELAVTSTMVLPDPPGRHSIDPLA